MANFRDWLNELLDDGDDSTTIGEAIYDAAGNLLGWSEEEVSVKPQENWIPYAVGAGLVIALFAVAKR